MPEIEMVDMEHASMIWVVETDRFRAGRCSFLTLSIGACKLEVLVATELQLDNLHI